MPNSTIVCQIVSVDAPISRAHANDSKRSVTYPVLHHRDLVCPPRGREPVRDEDDRLRPLARLGPRELVHRLEDAVLRVRVEGRGLEREYGVSGRRSGYVRSSAYGLVEQE